MFLMLIGHELVCVPSKVNVERRDVEGPGE